MKIQLYGFISKKFMFLIKIKLSSICIVITHTPNVDNNYKKFKLIVLMN